MTHFRRLLSTDGAIGTLPVPWSMFDDTKLPDGRHHAKQERQHELNVWIVVVADHVAGAAYDM
jgi:hypothetical protein